MWQHLPLMMMKVANINFKALAKTASFTLNMYQEWVSKAISFCGVRSTVYIIAPVCQQVPTAIKKKKTSYRCLTWGDEHEALQYPNSTLDQTTHSDRRTSVRLRTNTSFEYTLLLPGVRSGHFQKVLSFPAFHAFKFLSLSTSGANDQEPVESTLSRVDLFLELLTYDNLIAITLLWLGIRARERVDSKA